MNLILLERDELKPAPDEGGASLVRLDALGHEASLVRLDAVNRGASLVRLGAVNGGASLVRLDAAHRGASLVRLAHADLSRSAPQRAAATDPTESAPQRDSRQPRDTRADHLLHVLKVTPGQTVRVGVVDGPLGTGTVTAVTAAGVTLLCRFEDRAPERPRVDLMLAVPRPKVLRRLWAQLAAIGVGRILLTNAGRVERNYFDTHVVTPERYRPLLVEGLQQARDTLVPLVTVHRRFRALVEDELDALSPDTTRIVADPGATRPIGEVAAGATARVLLAVGPEGGWNAFELTLLQAHGFHLASMGARTLRTDTACIASLALVHDALSTRD